MGFITTSRQNKTYGSIDKEGRIKIKTKDGDIIYCNAVEGKLVEIESKDSEFEGTPTFKLQLTFEDQGELFAFQFGRYSNFGRDIILKLTKVMQTNPSTGFNNIYIFPFISEDEKNKKSYVRASLRSHNTKILVGKDDQLNTSMPALEKATIGKKEVTDDTARNEYIDKLISDLCVFVNADLKAKSQVTSDVEVEDEVPF